MERRRKFPGTGRGKKPQRKSPGGCRVKESGVGTCDSLYLEAAAAGACMEEEEAATEETPSQQQHKELGAEKVFS